MAKQVQGTLPVAVKRSAHLEHLFQERYEIRPLLYIVKRAQRLLNLLRVFLVLWV